MATAEHTATDTTYEHLAVPRPGLYKCAAFVTRAYLEHYGGLTYSGAENLKREGPMIVAPVHRSWADIPAICNAALEGADLQLHGVAKEEVLKNKLAKWFFESCGTIGIDREDLEDIGIKDASGGQEELGTARDPIGEVFDEDGALLYFPEGARRESDGDTVAEQKLRRGVIVLALTYGVPIIPVGISGTTKFQLNDIYPAHAHFGEALLFGKVPANSFSNLRNAVGLVKPHRPELFHGLQTAQTIAANARKL